ncbi:MAG: hypothetical protein V4686_01890 [Patescibacteria group bacterium]
MSEKPFSQHVQSNPHERVEYVRYTEAHKRAEIVKEKRMKGRELKDFIGGPFYTEAAISDAENTVQRIKEGFEDKERFLDEEQKERLHRSHMMASCLEGICLYTKSWFGPTTKTYPTTDWDDYTNGVDLIAERTQGDAVNHNGFALDVTFGGPKTVLKKVQSVANKIMNGKLGKVDFFKSDDGKFKGQLNNIPLVVIGASGNTMKGLINHFANPEEDIYLSEHPFQFQIIEDIIMQCDFFCEIAQQCVDVEKKELIVTTYTKLKQDFEKILQLKAKLSPQIDRNFRDAFHENLLEAMREIHELNKTL